MPRLSRIRIHNIHFDSGGQSRYFHDTIFAPRGNNSLLLLSNGGGKTLLLHLVAQVVLPNIKLQERRLNMLLVKEKFTGHVLVEWLLDGDVPRFLLTGFCFAESLGSAKRDMDYFNYMYEYPGKGSWDIESIPLVDHEGRNLNFKQLNDVLRDSPVAVYHSYRRGEYQGKLKTYNIDPREWDHVLRINNSEGGVEEFFEGCSKTRTLMNNLLVPMIDEVLERNEQRDTLQDAFRKVARQAIELPELKVQSDALGELSQRIPGILSAFEAVDSALKHKQQLNEKRSCIYQTLTAGLPRLESKLQRLDETYRGKGEEMEQASFMLEALEVEGYRRRWEKQQKEQEKQKEKVDTLQQSETYALQQYNRLLVNQKWEQVMEKKRRLAEHEQQLEKLKSGDVNFYRRLENLKEKALPLLKRNISALNDRISSSEEKLHKEEEILAGIEEDKNEKQKQLEEVRKKEYHFQQNREKFEQKREEASSYYQELGISFDVYAPQDGIKLVNEELEKSSAKLKENKQEAELKKKQQEEDKERLAEKKHSVERSASELEKHDQLYSQWRDEGDELRAELKIKGYKGDFPGNQELLLSWLEGKENNIKEEHGEYQKEQRHWEAQQELFCGNGAPRPNPEIDIVVEMLRNKEIAAQPAVELLLEYPEQKRQQIVELRPWLPYAVMVESSQLENLKKRQLSLSQELSAPVPLLSREEFYREGELQELYFISHRGLELFTSDKKADSYRTKIWHKMEEISNKLAHLDTEERSLKGLRKKIEVFWSRYPYTQDIDWQSKRNALEKELNQYKQEIAVLENKISEYKKALVDLEKEQGAFQDRINEMERAGEYGKHYYKEWEENKRAESELKELGGQRSDIEKYITKLEQKRQQHNRQIEELKEELKRLRSRLEEHLNFRDAHYTEDELAGCAVLGESLSDEEEEQLAGEIQEISAMQASLRESKQEIDELYRRIEEYKKDITGGKKEIVRLGFQPAEVEAKYFQVSDTDLEQAKKEWKRREQQLKEAEKDYNDAAQKVRGDYEVYSNRLEKLQKDYPGRDIPDLSEMDLDQEQARTGQLKREIAQERQELQKEIQDCRSHIDDYKRAINNLQKYSSELIPEAPPMSTEEEKELLIGQALDVVEENRRELEQAAADIEHYKQLAIRSLKNSEEELRKLHGDDIKRFFHNLQQRTAEAGWEERCGELQGQLKHALEAIERLQEHVQERLSKIDERIEEMALRTWRHVDSLLEQLRELHRRAGIELRGEKLNLFRIEFKKPEEEDCKAAIKEHLNRMVKEAARQHQQELPREEIDKFLDDAVKSAQLLDRVVPLDEISIRLLKPGDFEGSYMRKRYDRWDNLNEWSQGQRFAGRFSLFIVLLSYLRYSRSGGQNSSSVVLADNPFGKASSSHILEIINTITNYQNVQLFCCTALRNTEILREFPVIYSLVPVPTMSGRERMQLETSRGEERQALEQAHAYIPGIDPGDTGQLRLF